jgi:hypothetical protein
LIVTELGDKGLSVTKSNASVLIWAAILSLLILVLPISFFTQRKQAESPGNNGSMEQNTQSTPTPGRNRSTVESICFLRGDWIYLKNLSDGTETRLTKGAGPELSPTGEHLVFHAVKDEDSITDRLIPPPGRLRLLDVRTKAISEFEQLRNVRVGAAIWSNDGTRLAIWTARGDQKTPSIVIFSIGARKVEKEITTEGAPLDSGLFLDAWTPSHVSILFHIRRVSPTGVRGREPVWLPSDQEILF